MTNLEVGHCYKMHNSVWGTLYFYVAEQTYLVKSGEILIVEIDNSEYGTLSMPPYEIAAWPIKEYPAEEIPLAEFKKRLRIND